MKTHFIGLHTNRDTIGAFGLIDQIRTLSCTIKTPQLIAHLEQLDGDMLEIGLTDTPSNHSLARWLNEKGFNTRIVLPRSMNDQIDVSFIAVAESACRALIDPFVECIPLVDTDQQAITELHRTRSHLIHWRSEYANEIIAMTSVFCIGIPNGTGYIERRLPQIIDDRTNPLPATTRDLLRNLLVLYKEIGHQITLINHDLNQRYSSNDACREYARMPGVGPIKATALFASRTDRHDTAPMAHTKSMLKSRVHAWKTPH